MGRRADAGAGPGEALVNHAAVGLNYIDVYFRTGLYKAPSMPLTIGMEGPAPSLRLVRRDDRPPGDRVAYAGVIGAMRPTRVIAADRLVKLPEHRLQNRPPR